MLAVSSQFLKDLLSGELAHGLSPEEQKSLNKTRARLLLLAEQPPLPHEEVSVRETRAILESLPPEDRMGPSYSMAKQRAMLELLLQDTVASREEHMAEMQRLPPLIKDLEQRRDTIKAERDSATTRVRGLELAIDALETTIANHYSHLRNLGAGTTSFKTAEQKLQIAQYDALVIKARAKQDELRAEIVHQTQVAEEADDKLADVKGSLIEYEMGLEFATFDFNEENDEIARVQEEIFKLEQLGLTAREEIRKEQKLDVEEKQERDRRTEEQLRAAQLRLEARTGEIMDRDLLCSQCKQIECPKLNFADCPKIPCTEADCKPFINECPEKKCTAEDCAPFFPPPAKGEVDCSKCEVDCSKCENTGKAEEGKMEPVVSTVPSAPPIAPPITPPLPQNVPVAPGIPDAPVAPGIPLAPGIPVAPGMPMAPGVPFAPRVRLPVAVPLGPCEFGSRTKVVEQTIKEATEAGSGQPPKLGFLEQLKAATAKEGTEEKLILLPSERKGNLPKKRVEEVKVEDPIEKARLAQEKKEKSWKAACVENVIPKTLGGALVKVDECLKESEITIQADYASQTCKLDVAPGATLPPTLQCVGKELKVMWAPKPVVLSDAERQAKQAEMLSDLVTKRTETLTKELRAKRDKDINAEKTRLLAVLDEEIAKAEDGEDDKHIIELAGRLNTAMKEFKQIRTKETENEVTVAVANEKSRLEQDIPRIAAWVMESPMRTVSQYLLSQLEQEQEEIRAKEGFITPFYTNTVDRIDPSRVIATLSKEEWKEVKPNEQYCELAIADYNRFDVLYKLYVKESGAVLRAIALKSTKGLKPVQASVVVPELAKDAILGDKLLDHCKEKLPQLQHVIADVVRQCLNDTLDIDQYCHLENERCFQCGTRSILLIGMKAAQVSGIIKKIKPEDVKPPESMIIEQSHTLLLSFLTARHAWRDLRPENDLQCILQTTLITPDEVSTLRRAKDALGEPGEVRMGVDTKIFIDKAKWLTLPLTPGEFIMDAKGEKPFIKIQKDVFDKYPELFQS